MTAEVDLVNSALREIGAKAIAAISDTTPVGAIAGDVYEQKRDALLHAHPWNFATLRVRLPRAFSSFTSQVIAPASQWTYAYGLPSDWLRTMSVEDNDAGQGTVPYKQESINVSERITDGAFPIGTSAWAGTNWTVSSGVATHTSGATNALTQSATLTASALFRVAFEIVSRSAGTVTPTFSGGTGVSGTARSEVGFYAQELTAHSGGNTAFNIIPTSAFDGKVGEISVLRLDGDDVAQNAILSDAETIHVRYIRRVTDVDLMTQGFRQGLIYLLAKVFSIGPAASNTLRQINDADLKTAVRMAKSIDGIEDMIDQVPVGSWARSRGSNAWKRGSVWPSVR